MTRLVLVCFNITPSGVEILIVESLITIPLVPDTNDYTLEKKLSHEARQRKGEFNMP